ncbi:MAG: Dabb family protein [Myxococcota bacterium]
MKLIIALLAVLAVASCDRRDERWESLERSLEETRVELETLKRQQALRSPLVHLVFFDLRPDAQRSAFIAEIERLQAIAAIKKMTFGPFEDLHDPRALSEYELVMELRFASAEDYAAYQKDPLHLSVREALRAYLQKPPATYDFVGH